MPRNTLFNNRKLKGFKKKNTYYRKTKSYINKHTILNDVSGSLLENSRWIKRNEGPHYNHLNESDDDFEDNEYHTHILPSHQVKIEECVTPKSGTSGILSDRRLNELEAIFTKDINSLIQNSTSLKRLLLSDQELYNTAAGISKLTKLLVGEMGKRYLNDNLVQLGDSTMTSPKDKIQSQISDVQGKILDATTLLEKMKFELIEVEPDIEIIADENNEPIVIHYPSETKLA